MRFAERRRRKLKKWMLFPLMDMFFIILLFFLTVTSGDIGERVEVTRGHQDLTPKKSIGKVQLLLQVIDNESVLWLDNTSFYSGLYQTDFNAFLKENTITMSAASITKRLNLLQENAPPCLSKKITAVLRCPNDVLFGNIDDFQRTLDSCFVENMNDFTLDVCLMGGEETDISPAATEVEQNGNKVVIKW